MVRLRSPSCPFPESVDLKPGRLGRTQLATVLCSRDAEPLLACLPMSWPVCRVGDRIAGRSKSLALIHSYLTGFGFWSEFLRANPGRSGHFTWLNSEQDQLPNQSQVGNLWCLMHRAGRHGIAIAAVREGDRAYSRSAMLITIVWRKYTVEAAVWPGIIELADFDVITTDCGLPL